MIEMIEQRLQAGRKLLCKILLLSLPFALAAPALALQPGEPDSITIHYHRFDGNYSGVGLWSWDETQTRTPGTEELFPAGTDDFGPYFIIDPAEYGPEDKAAAIGFIPRLNGDWNQKDGTDRFWRPDMPERIWLIGNDPAIYEERPDISPTIQFAFIDGLKKLTVKLSHPANLDEIEPDTFTVKSGDPEAEEKTHTLSAYRPLDASEGKGRLFELSLAEDLDWKNGVRVDIEGYKQAGGTLRNLLFDKELFNSDVELGALYTKDATTFRVFAPTANAVDVILYEDPAGEEGRRAVPLEEGEKGIWEAKVEEDLDGVHYMLHVDAPGSATNREVVDIHSRANTGHDGRGTIVDLRRLDPEGFRPRNRPNNIQHPTDAVIWEISLRDFTMDASSGVPSNLRGKYKGAALRDTRVPGTDIKTGIDHLVDLGVTHVQILPIQDFDNRETSDQYNWGYMTSSFNSPDGWFASNHRNESRVREFKELVQAFHDAGIRVILDVVYNHTAPNATFESIVPGYYHRMRDDGSFYNGSGTGNEFRSEAPMARKFIVDSCRYWIQEYGLDGFRFDLMGLVDLETMKEIRREVLAIDPTLLVYGEPWAAGENGLARMTDKHAVAGTGVGAFNDHFRNAIKGPPDGGEPGFVHDGRNDGGVRSGIMASLGDWSKEPHDAVQYVTCHDNLTMWDKTLKAAPRAKPEEHVAMNKLAAGILAVSQGVMFLHGGHEFGYTKGGEHNSYNAPDSVNSLKWDRLKTHADLNDYVRGMIAIRRSHPLFRLRSAEEIQKRVKFLEDYQPSSRNIVFTIDGEGVPGETWKTALVIINGEREGMILQLPEGEWEMYSHDGKASTTPTGTAEMELLIPARSMTVLGRGLGVGD